MFHITPPPDRAEGEGEPFWLCASCWDGIIGDATLTRIRYGARPASPPPTQTFTEPGASPMFIEPSAS